MMSNADFYKRGSISAPPGMVSTGAPGVYTTAPNNFSVTNPFAHTDDPHGAFGSVPKDVPMPNPFGDLSSIYPGLARANAAVSGNIANQLAGKLSPETQAAIQDASARFGVTSGMPGSGLQNNRTVRDLGLATEGLQDQGLKNYLAAIGAISNTQTVNPTLQTEINTQNTLNRAAPNPTDAAAYSKYLFDQYLANLRGPGGGTGNIGGNRFQGFQGPAAASGTPSAAPGAGGFPTPFVPAVNPNATATTSSFQQPENWSDFSAQQQWDYPAQLDWARKYGNEYE